MVETICVDSGACDAVLTPQAFRNTSLHITKYTGTRYKACGGEPVTNLGQKNVSAIDSESNVMTIPFQVTDNITRNLLSVSKLAEQRVGTYFGPAPDYKAYMIHDPSQVNLGNGARGVFTKLSFGS